MEEKDIEIVEKTNEITDKSAVFSSRKAPNEKKNTIIIGAIALLLVGSFTATIIVGSINSGSNNGPQVPTLDWATNRTGFIDENGKSMSQGIYDIKIAKDDAGVEYAQIYGVKAPANAKEYVLPIKYAQGEGDSRKIYDFYAIGNSDGLPVLTEGSGQTIEAIYTQSLYREIKPYAFSGLSALKKVSFMNVSQGQMTIGAHAFADDAVLAEVKLPTQLKSIGDFAFEGCAALEKISITKNVTSIGEAAFKNSGIKEISFEGTEAEWLRVVKHSSWDEGITNYEIRFLK